MEAVVSLSEIPNIAANQAEKSTGTKLHIHKYLPR